MRLLFKLPSLLAEVLLAVGVLLVTLTRALWRSTVVIRDARQGLRTLEDGHLRCPRGHFIATSGDGEVYACEACGWTYENGSIFRCSNPECGATTSYVSCPTCGLSVRNPYRWGRP